MNISEHRTNKFTKLIQGRFIYKSYDDDAHESSKKKSQIIKPLGSLTSVAGNEKL